MCAHLGGMNACVVMPGMNCPKYPYTSFIETYTHRPAVIKSCAISSRFMPASHMPQELSLPAKATSSKLVICRRKRENKSRIECNKSSTCEPTKHTDTTAVEVVDVHMFSKFGGTPIQVVFQYFIMFSVLESLQYSLFSKHFPILGIVQI